LIGRFQHAIGIGKIRFHAHAAVQRNFAGGGRLARPMKAGLWGGSGTWAGAGGIAARARTKTRTRTKGENRSR
jgi:hypothetical protein